MTVEWQPIETAPKDGTPIRVYEPLLPWTEKVVMPAKWTGTKWLRLHRNGFFNMTANPTHWTPLSSPKETP